jgi:diguanylate cyclase (GGDEF)-like protein
VAGQDRGDLEQLALQVREATSAARDAYRDTARLIRLLSVLSSPAAPETLLGRALTVLSEVFASDIVCVTRVVGDRVVVVSASGVPDDDPCFVAGWPLRPAVTEAIQESRAVVDPLGEDLPSPLSGLGLRSAAYVPMWTGAEHRDELLMVFRSSTEEFRGADLHVLTSVAQRLRAAASDRERVVAIERLAHTGHQLARHRYLTPLVDEAAELLHRLTTSDGAWILSVNEGRAYRMAGRGSTLHEPPASGGPVTALQGWETVAQGRAWTRMTAGGTEAPGTVLCVPVMRDGAAVALLYAARDRPYPFGGEVMEIATIFADYVGAAMENVRLLRELRHQATRDPLTGLANRDLAGQRLEAALTGTGPVHAGLIFCDLDGFKAVNDRLGHEAGDDLLQQVAARLAGALPPGDLLARFGGDEFVAVLDDVARLDDVTEVGRSLVRALTRPFKLADEWVTVTASIGGVLGARGTTSASAMLRDADAAMYAAKARGPGEVEVFDEAASHRSLDRLGIRSELVRALERNEMDVVYQPIVQLDSNRVVGFEALLRWTHPQRGPIPPDIFIPLAEETGVIVPIGWFVLERACRQLAQWQRRPGWHHLQITVNLSAAQLWQENVADHILALMRAVGVDPRDVWLEVTERSYAGDDVTPVTRQLRAGGVHFALDDFGTSYSNLTYLKQFPAECLKIDRGFIPGVAEEGTDRSIVRAILAIADSLGLVVVAEGIERSSEHDALRALGCPFGQGYLFAPGLSPAEAGELLETAAGALTAARR